MFFGYYLFKYNGENAIFVHRSVSDKVAKAEGIEFPIDEFLCFFLAPVFDNFPLEYVVDWMLNDPQEVLTRLWGNITAVHHHAGIRPPFTLDL